MTGLPKTLETLLGSLLDTHNLQSWSIYNEKNGGCCLKIKWKPPHQESDIVQGTSSKPLTQKFKKKSPSSVKRDNLRSSDHHSGMMTRSRTKKLDRNDTIEEPRCEQVSDANFIQSPISIESSTPNVLMDSPPELSVGEQFALRSAECDLSVYKPECMSYEETLIDQNIADLTCTTEDTHPCLPENPEPGATNDDSLPSISTIQEHFTQMSRHLDVVHERYMEWIKNQAGADSEHLENT